MESWEEGSGSKIGVGIVDWGAVAPPSTVILSGAKDLGENSKWVKCR